MLVAVALVKLVRALANYIGTHRHALAAMLARPIFRGCQQSRARSEAPLPFRDYQPVHFRADLDLQQWLLAHMHPADHSVFRSIRHEHSIDRKSTRLNSSHSQISYA